MPETIEEITRSDVSPKRKKTFWEKEYHSGKYQVYQGLKQVKKHVGKEKAIEGIRKIQEGQNRARFAQIQLIKAGAYKRKKIYWK